jgi:peptide deformylase
VKIITVPHPSLRTVADPITVVDKKLKQLLRDLGKTLIETADPPGVGLAAPQVAVKRRLFATYLPEDESKDSPQHLRVIINPSILDFSDKVIFGPKKDEQRLEGCLSIPHIYGPVPRWQWVEYAFQELVEDELVERRERFADFDARVMQHEYDHLDGILFTDYALKYDLPIFKENPKTEKMEEIDKSVLELL